MVQQVIIRVEERDIPRLPLMGGISQEERRVDGRRGMVAMHVVRAMRKTSARQQLEAIILRLILMAVRHRSGWKDEIVDVADGIHGRWW